MAGQSVLLAACLLFVVNGVPVSEYVGRDGACYLHHGLESPCFELISKSEEYEIRRYFSGESWSSYVVGGPSDWKAQTKEGFMANFDYINGDNSAGIKIKMASPVATTRKATGEMTVSFFLPSELDPPPAPKGGSKVTLVHTEADRYFAVLAFPGYADGDSFTQKENALKDALKRDGVALWEGRHSWLSQYDPPFMPFFRHNEVWVPIKQPKAAN